jgi:hypothetical protein
VRTLGTDEVPYCAMCNSGDVVMRSILLTRNPGTYSQWFECRNCGYSSPGRLSMDEACMDVTWKQLGGSEQTEQEMAA